MPFPVDPKYIDQTEAKLSVTFPSMFRGKMIRKNGGSIETAGENWELYPFLDSSDRKRIARTCNDIVLETKRMRQWSNFPPGAVAIGGNGTADQLILLPKKDLPSELDPAIYWWDHETGSIQKVADDFAELVLV
jgi:hypothetical protein